MNDIIGETAFRTAENGRLHIESLLMKYPATNDDERQAILEFLIKAPALDTALLTCNEAISEKLTVFRHDHRKQLGITSRSWLILLILMGLVAVAVYLLSDLGY